MIHMACSTCKSPGCQHIGVTSTKNLALPTFSKKNTRSVSTKQSVPSSGGKRPWAKDCNCEALSICWEVRWGLSLSSLDFRRVQGTQPAFNSWKSDMRASRDTVRYNGGQSHSRRRSQCWKQSLRNRVVYVAHRLKNPTKDSHCRISHSCEILKWHEMTAQHHVHWFPEQKHIPQYAARGCAHLNIPFPFTL